MGNHPVPYEFWPFVDDVRGAPYDDGRLWAWVARDAPDDAARAWLQGMARLAAELRDTADFVERAENLPRLAGKGPYDNDPQQVVLPAETWEALAAVHGSGLWDPGLPERARYAAVYLLNQNGEMGVTCSVACTDGLRRLLRAFPDDERNRTVLAALEASTPAEWLHGAQFVTEIQGGSDAATNAVAARREPPDPEGAETWSLWGQKWFCSNLTADWWLVTARPEGAPGGGRDVALFLVPRDQDGITVERLKDKLGTRALPTAEIVFRGATGWPVGALQGGLRTMVEHVLVTSRIHNVLATAGFLRRAAREARAYARFRTAFGERLESMPLVAEVLERLEATAERAEAGAFATVDAWLVAQAPDAAPDDVAWARVAVSLMKAVTARRLPGLVYEAMMILGGNGIEERFTVLPRLWRDSAILETWEGPYSLLLMQALADLRRFEVAGREAAFLAPRVDDPQLARELAAILAAPDDPQRVRAWPALARRIVEGYEGKAVQS